MDASTVALEQRVDEEFRSGASASFSVPTGRFAHENGATLATPGRWSECVASHGRKEATSSQRTPRPAMVRSESAKLGYVVRWDVIAGSLRANCTFEEFWVLWGGLLRRQLFRRATPLHAFAGGGLLPTGRFLRG